MATKLINLTPHTVNVVDHNDQVVLSVPSTGMARAATSSQFLFDVDGIPVSKTAFGAVSGLPDPVDGTIYIVSMVVAQAANRPDVVAPDSGPSALRHADGPNKGQIIGVRGFVQY